MWSCSFHSISFVLNHFLLKMFAWLKWTEKKKEYTKSMHTAWKPKCSHCTKYDWLVFPVLVFVPHHIFSWLFVLINWILWEHSVKLISVKMTLEWKLSSWNGFSTRLSEFYFSCSFRRKRWTACKGISHQIMFSALFITAWMTIVFCRKIRRIFT